MQNDVVFFLEAELKQSFLKS